MTESDPDRPAPRRVHVVLGAGGERGWDWTVGCLFGLADRAGFDARRASTLVGTSVGSLVATYLAHDTPVVDLAGHVGGPPDPDARTVGTTAALRSGRTDRAVVGVRRAAGIAIGFGLRRSQELPVVSAELRRRLDIENWPDHLRVVGWDRRSLRRVVFTADSGVDLGVAVDASCAVPGLYPAVELGGGALVDGGVWSMTNADLAPLGTGEDLLVVIAPTVSSVRRPTRIGDVARWAHTVTLRHELAAVPASRRIVLAPSNEWSARASDTRRRDRIALARAEAISVLGDPGHTETVAGLTELSSP